MVEGDYGGTDPMTSSSSPNDPDVQVPEANWLDQGLQALKQGDTLTALSYLGAVAESHPNQPLGWRAQMGLVAAYEKHGQPEQAIAYCQQLRQSSNSQVKNWAEKNWETLSKRYPDHLPAAEVNPAPSAATPCPTPEPESPPASDPTGFVPLNPSPSVTTSDTTPEKTGFVPLDPLDQPSQRQRPPASRVKPSRPSSPSPSKPAPISSPSRTNTPQPESPDLQEIGSEAFDVNDPSPSTVNEAPPAGQQLVLRPQWRQAGRIHQLGQFLPRVKLTRLRILEIATPIAIYASAFWFAYQSIDFFNLLLKLLPLVEPILGLYFLPYSPLLVTLLLLAGLSPWILEGILKHRYGMQTLPMAQLSARSPETAQLLNRIGRQKQWGLPGLALIPSPIPLALTFGLWPKQAKIVVSQGLLDRLSPDEIATIYATELGHLTYWDMAIATAATAIVQVPYLIYWEAATRADQFKQQWETATPPRSFLLELLLFVCAVISSVSYGAYWILRWPALWLSRERIEVSDRLAVEWTGNPNGLIRALLKIAIGIAETVQQQGKTDPLLESLSLLTPLDGKTAITIGSIYPHLTYESALEWEYSNPYRHWLNWNQAHPLLGERLQRLGRYARFWHLETELDWERLGRSLTPQRLTSRQDTFTYWSRLCWQGGPFFGLLLGISMGLTFWLIGAICHLLDLWQFTWLMGDRTVMIACIPAGVSIGIFLRINRFFPDIKLYHFTKPKSPGHELAELVDNALALPLDSQPVRLTGKLLGRPGVRNWLGQDLILQTESGLVRLHHVSALGPWMDLRPQVRRPADWVGQTVTAIGWFRRGATVWIDLDTLKNDRGQSIQSGHPIWSTILAVAAACWSTYIILNFAGIY